MTETDLSQELRTAAKLASDAGATGAAEIIHSLINPRTDAHIRFFRKTILRSIWRKVFYLMPRTAAAKAIASAWFLYSTTSHCEHEQLRVYFSFLDHGGASPLSWRQIADDLDAGFDRD